MARMILTCSTCGAVVISMDEHLKFITARRERYGATWHLERRKTYTPVSDADESDEQGAA